jgi:hypothetical protein
VTVKGMTLASSHRGLRIAQTTFFDTKTGRELNDFGLENALILQRDYTAALGARIAFVLFWGLRFAQYYLP